MPNAIVGNVPNNLLFRSFSDSELLIQLDPTAFEQIYDRHARYIFSIALRIVKDAATAEEIVQEIFILFWRNCASYEPSVGPLMPWLSTLARNKALDHVRSKAERQRQTEEPPDNLPEPFGHSNPERAFDDMRRIDRIRAAFATLRAGERAAVELAYFVELTQPEIAARLDVPLGTAKSWIRTRLIQLREILQASSAAAPSVRFLLQVTHSESGQQHQPLCLGTCLRRT